MADGAQTMISLPEMDDRLLRSWELCSMSLSAYLADGL